MTKQQNENWADICLQLLKQGNDDEIFMWKIIVEDEIDVSVKKIFQKRLSRSVLWSANAAEKCTNRRQRPIICKLNDENKKK